MSGTSGQSKRLEAIQIKLTGAAANNYDVYYRVHCQNFGWMGWAKNGASAGTSGYSKRLEGIEIKVVPKGSAAPGSTENSFKDKNEILPTGVTINGSNSIEVGSSATLTATVEPSNATDKTVTWSSSNKAVATVTSAGKVTGVKTGSATITVKTRTGISLSLGTAFWERVRLLVNLSRSYL